jgi:uncharacterized protein
VTADKESLRRADNGSKSMRYLIDGYNLLHAAGSLHGRVGPTALRRARLALLELLHRGFGGNSSQLTVVFDAAGHLAGAPVKNNYQGIDVLFAVEQASADELIETLIRQAHAPKRMTVVSSDHRIQQAASRRACIVKGSSELLDDLQRISETRRPIPLSPAEKPVDLPESEHRHWLREFGGLDSDPNLKFLSDPVEWSEHRF